MNIMKYAHFYRNTVSHNMTPFENFLQKFCIFLMTNLKEDVQQNAETISLFENILLFFYYY